MSAAELSTPCFLLVITEIIVLYILFVYFNLRKNLKENTLQIRTSCWAVLLVMKRELIFVFLISLTMERFLLKHHLYRSKVYGIKAKFLSFHRERGEAGEYCLRMFHIPTALPVLTGCSVLLSLFLNHSSLLCISPHFPPLLLLTSLFSLSTFLLSPPLILKTFLTSYILL